MTDPVFSFSERWSWLTYYLILYTSCKEREREREAECVYVCVRVRERERKREIVPWSLFKVNQLEGHTGPVTSINVVHYSGSARSLINQVWTSSLDGTIRFWNFSTGSCLRVVNIGKPIYSMVSVLVPLFSLIWSIEFWKLLAYVTFLLEHFTSHNWRMDVA